MSKQRQLCGDKKPLSPVIVLEELHGKQKLVDEEKSGLLGKVPPHGRVVILLRLRLQLRIVHGDRRRRAGGPRTRPAVAVVSAAGWSAHVIRKVHDAVAPGLGGVRYGGGRGAAPSAAALVSHARARLIKRLRESLIRERTAARPYLAQILFYEMSFIVAVVLDNAAWLACDVRDIRLDTLMHDLHDANIPRHHRHEVRRVLLRRYLLWSKKSPSSKCRHLLLCVNVTFCTPDIIRMDRLKMRPNVFRKRPNFLSWKNICSARSSNSVVENGSG